MNLPNEIEEVLKQLQNSGYEAYCVGGCVRDNILHQECQDYDITTNASMDEIRRIFSIYSHFNLGKKHDTVTIHIGNHFVEITPFKGNSLEEDLQHRDLTINAIAYAPGCGYISLENGEKDIKNRMIRFVGDGKMRIQEDPVRMLRAIRFSCRYDFSLGEETAQNIKIYARLLENVAKERIRAELLKILKISEKGILMMHELGLLAVIEPELDCMFSCEQNNPHHYTNVGEHMLDALKSSYAIAHYFDDFTNDCLRVAILFHDVGKRQSKCTDETGIDHFYRHSIQSFDIASKFMMEYKFSNKEKLLIEKLILNHDYPLLMKFSSIRKMLLKHKMYPQIMKSLLALQYCDKSAQNQKGEKIDQLKNFSNMYFDVVSTHPYRIEQLKINGKDILMTVPALNPKKIPELQRLCLDRVFQHPNRNTKEYLLDIIKRNERE